MDIHSRAVKIAVGSLTPIKIDAVRAALSRYPEYADAEIAGVGTDSGVPAQPFGMDETMLGAENRARRARETLGADLGIGLEGGLIPVPRTLSGFMNVGVCAIHDGRTVRFGLSGGFEYPGALVEKVLREGTEISVAARELGIVSEDDPFRGQEIIGRLTDGVVMRGDELATAVHMALVQLRKEGY